MSPQILKSLNYTYKADIWALGMIYYELLNGRTPWYGRTQYELVTKIQEIPVKFNYKITISEKSKKFIKGCLEVNESSRYDWKQIFDSPIFKDDPKKKNTVYNFKNTDPKELDDLTIQLIKDIQLILEDKNVIPTKLFERLDKSHDNNLDLEEFTFFVKDLFPDCNKSLIEHVFNKFDADNNGTLSVSEFKMIILEKDFNTYTMYKDPLIFEKAERVLGRLRKIGRSQKVKIFLIEEIKKKIKE